MGGNWLYIDNFRVGNLSDSLSRFNQDNYINDSRIFDLFGREYHHQSSLKKGVYIQNNKLFFIRED